MHGWLLDHGASIKHPDLSCFEKDMELLKSYQAGGFNHNDCNFDSVARDMLRCVGEDEACEAIEVASQRTSATTYEAATHNQSFAI